MPAVARHIGLLLHDFRLGGSERIAIRLAREWVGPRAAGHAVRRRGTAGPMRELVSPTVAIHVYAGQYQRSKWHTRRLARWAARAATDAGVDAMFLPGNSYFRAIPPLSRRLPVLAKLSNPIVRPDKSLLRNLVFRISTARRWRRLQGLVVCSAGQAEEIRRQVRPRIPVTVIDNPILDALPTGMAVDKAAGQLCAVGRLELQKNYPLMFKAFALLHDLPLDLADRWRWQPAAPLERLAVRLGIADRVEFLGTVQDATPLMAQSEALLLSSNYEASCAVCVEALAVGTYVIARDCGSGVREILRAPRTSTIVTEATPQALATAVRDYLQKPCFRRRRRQGRGSKPLDRTHRRALSCSCWTRQLPPDGRMSAWPSCRGQAVWVMAKGYAPDEGGMQTYSRAVAEAYAALGATVTVFTRTSAGPRDVQVGPVRVVDVGPRRGWKMHVRIARALRRERRRQGTPLLLHASTWKTSIVPMLLGLPYVTTFHGREVLRTKGWKLALMSRIARRARRVVAVSHYNRLLRARIAGLGLPPVVAWNGVTSGLARGNGAAAADQPLLFTVCRMEPRKNLRAAIEAAATCRREGLRFRYVLAGRGEELQALRALIDRHALGDVVELAGFIDQARAVQLYRDADIFIHPQVNLDGGRDFEGFGIAIADAMYTRTAVIAGTRRRHARTGGGRRVGPAGGWPRSGRGHRGAAAAAERSRAACSAGRGRGRSRRARIPLGPARRHDPRNTGLSFPRALDSAALAVAATRKINRLRRSFRPCYSDTAPVSLPPWQAPTAAVRRSSSRLRRPRRQPAKTPWSGYAGPATSWRTCSSVRR